MAQHEHVRVAVIGSGFGGPGGRGPAAPRRASPTSSSWSGPTRVGGTWRDNSYPGCACDVPSHLYSFSFAPNPDWPRTFSGQEHIRAYLEHVADTFGLRPHICASTHEVTMMRWDAERAALGDRDRAAGPSPPMSSSPRPGRSPTRRCRTSPGSTTFPGKVFHSARWDHDYDLRGKRVAMIGTGASAIQIVPAIQPEVAQLTLFQRTPPWVMPRIDRAISGAERWLHRAAAVHRRRRGADCCGASGSCRSRRSPSGPNELGLVEQLAKAQHRPGHQGPGAAGQADPVLPHRLQADPALQHLLPGARPAQCGRGRLRAERGARLHRRRRRRDARPRSTRSSSAPASMSRTCRSPTGSSARTGITLAEAWKDGMQSLRGATAAGLPQLDDDHRPQHRARELLA